MTAAPASRLLLRPLVPSDWEAVRRIYEEGIAGGDATFETRAPSWEDWNAARSPECRLVAVAGGAVVGFAALSPVSARSVYRGVREVMLYVAASARRRGVGKELLGGLVRASEAAHVWTLEAGIFPENEASLALFKGAGFRRLGVHERLGRFRDGRWRDVVVLERRSRVVGAD